MTSNMCKPVGSARAGDHCCLSFDSDAEQRDVVAAYVRDGLEQHDKVVYFAAGEPTTVLGFLAEGGIEPGPCLESGQLRVLSPLEGFFAHGAFDPDVMVSALRKMATEALDEGYHTFRATGEASAVRTWPCFERLLEYERKVDVVYADRNTVGLCQYDRRMFSAAELRAAEDAHSVHVGPDPIYRDSLLSITRTYDPPGLRIVGEIDSSRGHIWRDALAAEAEATGDDVHLDVSGLRFVDVGGARLLARTADELGRRRCRLLLHRISEEPRRLLRLTGWEQLPALVVEER